MPSTPLPALQSGRPSAWEEAIYAFLVEKRSRSGSTRTVESYARMLWPFFAAQTPDQVRSADVLGYAHGIGPSGRTPSSATVGARIACVSSFYRFAIRIGLLATNPCEALERPKTVPSVARGYSADEVRRLLAVVPDTVAGRRDRAILLVLVLTGRRRAEVLGLRAGDITLEGETVFYAYRGKGGKRGRRELPRPAHEAIRATLGDAGLDLAVMGTRLSRCGRQRRDHGASAAAPSTGASAAISSQQGSRRPGSTCCATVQPSFGVRPGSRSRRSARSWTTHRWRSRRSISDAWRASKTSHGEKWQQQSGCNR